MDRKTPLNEEVTAQVLASVEDPVSHALLQVAIAEARMRFMRRSDQTQAAWESQLPDAPFDMAFFAEVLKAVFERKDLLRRLLDGQSPDEATGWDV